MKYLEYTLSIISILINLLVFTNCYGKISNKKFDLKNLKNILLLLVYTMSAYLLNLYVPLSFRWISIFITMIIFNKIFYSEENFISIFKTIIIYFIMMMLDFLLSILITQIPTLTNLMTMNISLSKSLVSILISILLIILFNLNVFTKIISKFCNYININKKSFYLFFAIFTFVSFFVLEYYHRETATLKSFIISSILIAFFLLLCIILLYQYFKNKNSEEEQQTLLNLMNEYETILDNDRINRHEMLNNLVVLKSYPKKNTKEYEKVLDDIIETYQNKKSKNYANLYSLPSGIKGIVYYKIANINDNNIKFNTYISKESAKNIEKLDSKLYFNICKIMGILLDNAIEACKETDNKEILLDIYSEDKVNFIYIENTFKGNVDINQINKKGFSSKGKGRGLGLHVVNKIIKDNKELDLEQNINNKKFITILKIKNPD